MKGVDLSALQLGILVSLMTSNHLGWVMFSHQLVSYVSKIWVLLR